MIKIFVRFSSLWLGLLVLQVTGQTPTLSPTPSPTFAQCPATYTYINEVGCIKLGSSKVSRSDANAACVADGGWLVSILSSTGNTNLYNYIASVFTWTAWYNGPWIGLNDIETEGVYKWSKDGSTASVLLWRTGQPDDSNGAADCVTMTGNGFWNDWQCTDLQQYICQVADIAPTVAPTRVPTLAPTTSPTAVPTSSPTLSPTVVDATSHPTFTPTLSPTPAPTSLPTLKPTANPTSSPTFPRCTASYTYIADLGCVKLGSSKVSWNDAKTACNAENGWLVKIESSSANTNLYNYIASVFTWTAWYNGPWIGLNDIETEGVYMWSKDGSTASVLLWRTGQPDDSNGIADCVTMTQNGMWNDWQCTDLQQYICQVADIAPTATPTRVPTYAPSAVPTVAPTSVPTRVPTYAPSAVPTVAPTSNPTAVPTSLPTALPTFSPTSTPTLNPTWAPTSSPTTSPPTIAPSPKPTFVPTMSPSPLPTSSPTIAPSSSPTVNPTANPTSSPTFPRCTASYTYIADLGCVKLGSSKVSWDDAKTACNAENGWLVKIESSSANTNLYNYIASVFTWTAWYNGPWIGLNDIETEGVYKWSKDGSTASVLLWRTGQPDDSNGTADCVTMTGNGFWNDWQCTDLQQYICQVADIAPTVVPTAAPTRVPTYAPSAVPTVAPTVPPTSVPTVVPTSKPSFIPTSLLSAMPTAGPTERFISSTNSADANMVLIAWSVSVSVVVCLLIVIVVVFNVRSQRRKLQELQSKYASVSSKPNNNGNNGVANSTGPHVILGCDIESDSAHFSAGSIELKIMDTPAIGLQYEGDTAESTPLADPMISTAIRGRQVPMNDEDDETRSSVSSISEAGLSLTTPKLPYNYDEDDDQVIVTLHTPIRDGMTSSGLAYVVRGAMNGGGVNTSDIPIVVKFVLKEHAHVLQHELKQLQYLEEKIKPQKDRFCNIVQPLVSDMVSADSACKLRQHNRDQEQIDKWIGIVLESGDRNIKQLLNSYPLQHHVRLCILTDLLNALYILEYCNIVHLDVKPTNIISLPVCYKLIDFDISLRRCKPIPVGGRWTARYSAPEIAKHRRNGGTLLSDHKMDMWSFGMIAVEIFCGRDFWSLMGVSDAEIECKLSRLTNEDIRLFLDRYVRNDEDAALRSVLESTLVVNPVDRFAASAVLRKSYFNGRDSTVVNQRAQVTEEIRKTVVHISAKMDDVISILRSNEEMLTTLLTGRYMIPSLFVIVPSTSTMSEKGVFSCSLCRKAMLYEYRLFFICPITKQLAKCGPFPDGSGYQIRVPREWLIKAAPAIKFCLCAIKILISAYGIPPAMIPSLHANSWASFGDTIQQCIRRDGGDAGERAFSSLEECFNDMTDSSLETLSKLTAKLQNVTSQSFNEIAWILQNAEGAPKPVPAGWRPKHTGLVEARCPNDGSTMWVHESVEEQYRLQGKKLLLQLAPV